MLDRLTPADYNKAAAKIGCSVPMIRAVIKVESPKGAYNADGTLTKLFEAHKFDFYTGGRFRATHPTLSSRTWDRRLYASSWQRENLRYAEAGMLDAHAAILSTSFGMFQIMGFNHRACGFETAEAMVLAFSAGEPGQLDAFVNFVIHEGLDDELRNEDFTHFALGYNGRRAVENGYPTKIAAAHGWAKANPNLA